MRLFTHVASALLLLLAYVANADLCEAGAIEIMGNYYCQPVKVIQYQTFEATGSYNRVTNMDPYTGECSSEAFGYSGSSAPLNGEVSVHYRGPFKLKQFAYYTPGNGGHLKINLRYDKLLNVHGRGALIRATEKIEREVEDMVIATIDGQVVAWINEWNGTGVFSTQIHPPATTALLTAPTEAPTVKATYSYGGSSTSGSRKTHGDNLQSNEKPFRSSYTGDWVQEAYYHAESGIAKGITFLNSMGGQGSGTFDYHFGNSLSYASSDGKAGASHPQILEDVTLPSNTEVVLMSDKPCIEGSTCGYSRPGTVAMHGFGGGSKVFLFEFAMPSDGTTSGLNADMPALWLLNAEIPRTLQYGNAECSCWASGCGEFDLFEVLDPGNTRCKSTLHGGIQGGDSDYFDRPTGNPIKVAVVMSDSIATIKILPDHVRFPKMLTNNDVARLGSHQDADLHEDLGTSIFDILN